MKYNPFKFWHLEETIITIVAHPVYYLGFNFTIGRYWYIMNFVRKHMLHRNVCSIINCSNGIVY